MNEHGESSSGEDGVGVTSRTAAEGTALGNSVGVVTGLVGAGFALFTLTTPILKILGVIAWASVAVVILQAAREHSKGLLSRTMLVVLSISGATMLVFVIFLGAAQPVDQSTEADGTGASGGGGMSSAPRSADSSEVATTTTVETTIDLPSESMSSPPGSETAWLADIQPVENPSADSPWSVKSMQVKGIGYDYSITPPDYSWCGWTQSDYVLGGGYSRFEAMVAIADNSPSTGPLNFYVLADDKRIETVTDVGIAAPRKVDVPVEGVSRLAIGIESPQGRDSIDCPGPEKRGCLGGSVADGCVAVRQAGPSSGAIALGGGAPRYARGRDQP